MGETIRVLVARCKGCGVNTAAGVLYPRGLTVADIGELVLDNLDKQIEVVAGPVGIGHCKCGEFLHAGQPEASAAGGGGLIYLASPYSHEDTAIRDERFNIVCRVAARLMAQGHLIFSPIAHTHPIAMAGELPTGWDFWQKYDHAHLDAAAQVWVLRIDGWDRSTGVKEEIDYAMSKGKPVAYVCPTPNDLHPAPAPELAELRADNAKLRSGFHAQLEIAAEGVRENAELRAEVERLTSELKIYKNVHNYALECVDRAFQSGGEPKPALLPDFLPIGACKFEGVVKLAEAYVNLTTRAETAERERDEAREALAAVFKRIEQTAALAPTGDADGHS